MPNKKKSKTTAKCSNTLDKATIKGGVGKMYFNGKEIKGNVSFWDLAKEVHEPKQEIESIKQDIVNTSSQLKKI